MSWRLFYDIVNNEIWGDFVILSPLGMNGLIALNTCTKYKLLQNGHLTGGNKLLFKNLFRKLLKLLMLKSLLRRGDACRNSL